MLNRFFKYHKYFINEHSIHSFHYISIKTNPINRNTYSCEFDRLHATGVHVGVAREKEGHVMRRWAYIPWITMRCSVIIVFLFNVGYYKSGSNCLFFCFITFLSFIWVLKEFPIILCVYFHFRWNTHAQFSTLLYGDFCFGISLYACPSANKSTLILIPDLPFE